MKKEFYRVPHGEALDPVLQQKLEDAEWNRSRGYGGTVEKKSYTKYLLPIAAIPAFMKLLQATSEDAASPQVFEGTKADSPTAFSIVGLSEDSKSSSASRIK